MTRMETVTGFFNSNTDATAAVEALKDAGIPWDDVSLISPTGEEIDADNSTAEGIGVGGILVGLAAFAIPGIGPVVGAGWLASAIAGAAAGSVAGGAIGALTGAGVDERDAQVYAETIKRGGSVVTVRAEGNQADLASSILMQAGAVKLEDRRAEYETAGWEHFDETIEPRSYRPRDEPDAL
jgi:hypothetical protein